MKARTLSAILIVIVSCMFSILPACAKPDPTPSLDFGVCANEPADSGALKQKKWFICRLDLFTKKPPFEPKNATVGVAAETLAEAENKVYAHWHPLNPNPDSIRFSLNGAVCVPATAGWAPMPGMTTMADNDILCQAKVTDFAIQGCDFTSLINECTNQGTQDCPRQCVQIDAGVGACNGIPAFAGACDTAPTTGSGMPCTPFGDTCGNPGEAPCCGSHAGTDDACTLSACEN